MAKKIVTTEAFQGAIKSCIEQGDVTSLLVHAAAENLSAKDLERALGQLTVVLAEKYERDAELVATSVKGIERLAGGNSYELEQAGHLREMAQRLLIDSMEN